MAKVLIWPNPGKEPARGLSVELAHWLVEGGHVAMLPDELADVVGLPTFSVPWNSPQMRQLDWSLVLGGDGTLLRAAKRLVHLGQPLLGVNMGHVGFLTEVEVPELYPVLGACLDGDFEVDARYLLSARVIRAGQEMVRYQAMNDVVVTKGPFARLVNLETYVGDQYVATYPADGLIVATPTGSTAYSLSAGGPILTPDLDVMVITPICAHTFFDRSVVIDGRQHVKIRLQAGHTDTLLTVDGQEGYGLQDGDEIWVEASRDRVHLIRRPGWNFFKVLQGWRKSR